ncbi:hypothetical protein BH24ACT13_BH24ACT13_07410 [soil metagenome]
MTQSTSPTTSGSSQATAPSSASRGSKETSSELSKSSSAGSALESPQGRTTIADSVVTKIAGIAAREVSGVHNLGKGGTRAFGALKERIPGSSGPSVTQGVSVEVGERQAAIDLDIVVEYGVAIAELAKSVRRNVISSVERMTGLEVVEVNISVDDVHLQGEDSGSDDEQKQQEQQQQQQESSRVQ